MIIHPPILSLGIYLAIISRTQSADAPVVETTFDENFTSQPYFVDKTLLLREIFKNELGPDYNYIAYPSKFGKTLTLQMIKTFAQIEVTDRRVLVNWTDTKAYQLFKDLKIARHQDILEKHLARYAVIHLDLKHDVEEPINDENVIMALNEVIQKSYLEYRWVVKIAKNLVRNPYACDTIMDKGLQGTLDKVEIREGVQFLAQLLKDYFGVKVLLLVDNYDYFFNKAFLDGREHIDRYRKILNLIMKKTFTYGNCYISHAFIFGSCSMNYHFSSYNYPKVGHYELGNWMFLSDDRFGPFIGFNEYDIQSLCQRYRCANEEKDSLKAWYNGYLTRKLSNEAGDKGEIQQVKYIDFQPYGREQKPIYNPYSISRYFSDRRFSPNNALFKPYWTETQDLQFIYSFLRVPEFRHRFVELFKYDGIEMPSDRDKIPQVFHRFTSSETLNDQKINLQDADSLLVGFFFDSGYLSYAKDLFYVAKIPNHEVHRALAQILVQFYHKRGMPIEEIRQCFDQIIVASSWDDTSKAADRAQEVLSKTFRAIFKPSYYKSPTPSEPLYRVLLPKGLEFHNVLFTAAFYTSLRRPNTVTDVTEVGEYRERDDIMLHDRANNTAVIIRIRNQTNMEKTIPVGFRKALKPKKNITKIKFLVVKIDRNNQLETMVQVFN